MNYVKRMVMTAMAVALFMGLLTYSHGAFAATPTPPGGGLVAQCEDYPGITYRIVGCVRMTLENASGAFFVNFFPLVKGYFNAVLTLGVAIYGVMMAAGMVEKIGRDSIVLLLKIAFVAYFVQNIGGLYSTVTDMMDAMSAAVFNFATINHPSAPVCMIGKANIWERMDCLIDTLFGLKSNIGAAPAAAGAAADATSNIRLEGNGLARGLIAFFGSALVSSVPGFIVGIIGFMFLYIMLFFMLKVIFVYLMAYMAILFLLIIGPFFMPLVLFRVTKQYFDNWVKLIISCAMQPVLMVVFVSFAVAAVDVVVFSGDKSFVRTIAGDAATASGFNLNRYIESKGGYVDHTFGPTVHGTSTRNIPSNSQVRQGITGSLISNDCGLTQAANNGVNGVVTAAQECAEGWVVGITTKEIDWKKLAEARQPPVVQGDAENLEQAFMRELYASAILTAVMMFIINALMKVVPQLANDLVGSYRQTPNMMGLAGGWKWQQGGSSQIASQMTSSVRSSSGGQQRPT